MRQAILTFSVLTFLLIFGCGGGGGPVTPVFEISIIGPNSVTEGSQTKYQINISGDSVLSCEWSSSAGVMENPKDSSAIFCAPLLDSNTEVTIRVAVNTKSHGLLDGDLSVLVCDVIEPQPPVPELTVSEIIGPLTVAEGTWVTYGVEATGDTGITYKWSVSPPDAGLFSHPESRYTNFTAHFVDEEETASIKLEVGSDNGGPKERSLIITITPAPAESGCFLSVGNITGPGSVEEGLSGQFAVMAQSNRNLTYHWTVDPPDAGYFDTPDEMSTNFIASDPNPIIFYHPPSYDYHYQDGYSWTPPVEDPHLTHLKSATISVIVSAAASGECYEESVEKTRDVALHNDPPIVAWINNPTEIMENQEVPFSVLVKNLPGPINGNGVHVDWVVDPPYAGTLVTKQEIFDPIDNKWDNYINLTVATEVVFKAAMVQEDTEARIAIFYVIDNDLETRIDDEWTLLDSIPITILNNANPEVEIPDLYDPLYGPTPYYPPPGDPPPMNHWTEPTGIVGPTEVVAATFDIEDEEALAKSYVEHRFYFGIPDADPSWQFGDITWNCEIIYDGWEDGMPYFGEIPNPDFRFGIYHTLDENREITNQVIEFIIGGIEIETWLKLTATVPGGETHEFIIVGRPPNMPCWEISPIQTRWYSSYYTDNPHYPPIKPITPPPNKMPFDKYNWPPQPPPYIIKKGDIIRLFVIIYLFRDIDGIEFIWGDSPGNLGAGHDPNGNETVHFWGDIPYEPPNEANEPKWGPYDPPPCPHWTCGSVYTKPGGNAGDALIFGVELTCHYDGLFEIMVEIKSEECGIVYRSIKFNEE